MNIETGRAIELSNFINYQPGAVVSRQILKKKTGTITLFAFDKDQGLSEHTAPFHALVYCLDGQGKITISGKATRLDSGQMILMPAKQPHSLKAVPRFRMLLVMVSE